MSYAAEPKGTWGCPKVCLDFLSQRKRRGNAQSFAKLKSLNLNVPQRLPVRNAGGHFLRDLCD